MFKRCCASTYFDVSLRPSASCKVRSLAVDTGCPGNRAYFDCLRLAVFQMSHLNALDRKLSDSQNFSEYLSSFEIILLQHPFSVDIHPGDASKSPATCLV